jgi:hypothetical protein
MKRKKHPEPKSTPLRIAGADEFSTPQYVPRKPNVGEVLQDLYDSGINASLSWTWDEGIDVVLDDEWTTRKENIVEAARWLIQAACEEFPESKFAKKWKRQPRG